VSDVAERFAPIAAANRLAPLVRGELKGSAQAQHELGALPDFGLYLFDHQLQRT
jgi:hypothetical protein